MNKWKWAIYIWIMIKKEFEIILEYYTEIDLIIDNFK